MSVLVLSTRAKLAASAGLLAVSAGAAGLGTFGSFTTTTTADLPVTSGTVTIALGAAGTAADRLTIAASGVVPGDTIQRAAVLTNTGTDDLSAVALTTTAAPSSLLDTSTTMGLQMTVDECSVPWTEAGTAPAYTYTCSGTTTTPIASRPVIGADLDLGGLAALTAGGSDNLRVTLALPAGADNTLQGQSSTIDFAFTGSQSAGTNR